MSMTLQFVLFVLTVWSLARFFAFDAFPPVRAFRTFLARWADGEDGDGSRFAEWTFYLVTCVWCSSPYIGLVVWALAEATTDLSFPAPALWIIAARPLAGVLNGIEDMIDAITAR